MVTPKGIISAKEKEGKAKLYGYAKDGSGKKITLTVNIKKSPVGATPTPVFEEDSRTATTIENFESYAPGTKWANYTAGGYTKSGTMTVVKDPENSANKVLKIDYTGTEQAYDFAPVFNITLPNGKKLSDYSAVRLKSRVIANTSDCNYKTIGVFFDGYKTIKPSDYFYTSNYDGSSAKKAPEQKYRFGVNLSMATGVDKNYNVPKEVKSGYGVQDKDIIAISPLKKYNNKVFPTYYQDYASGTDKNAISPGYSENETNATNKVGFQQNTLEFDNTRIADAWISGDDNTPLLNRNQFDMVLGATYKGSQGLPASDYHMILYLDDIQVMSGTIACKSMSFVNPPKKMVCGNGEIKPGTATLEISYNPTNTTQKEVTYTSSDPSLATVDVNGIVTANNEGKTGSVTIRATNKANKNLMAETTIIIETLAPATEDYDILANAKVVAKSTDEKAKVKSDIDNVKLQNGQLTINYDSANQSVTLDLGQEINLNRYKGIELTGNMPGQIAVEFYGSNLDMTQTKDNGAEKNWWDTISGKTFPFYNGSSSQRTEAGGMDKNVLIAKGKVDSAGKAAADDETLRYSLQKLGDSGTGDWSAIRYVVVKSNNAPNLPAAAFDASSKKENRKTFLYTLKAFKLTTREVYDCDEANRYTIVTDTPENVAAEGDTAKAYYVDNVSQSNPADKHNAKKDLQDFKFIKVVVENAAEVKVGLLKSGQQIGEYTTVGQSTGVNTKKTVYYRIDNLGEEVDIHEVDAIVVDLPEGGVLSKLQLIQGEIAYNEDEPAQYDLIDGQETAVTAEKYGKN